MGTARWCGRAHRVRRRDCSIRCWGLGTVERDQENPKFLFSIFFENDVAGFFSVTMRACWEFGGKQVACPDNTGLSCGGGGGNVDPAAPAASSPERIAAASNPDRVGRARAVAFARAVVRYLRHQAGTVVLLPCSS